MDSLRADVMEFDATTRTWRDLVQDSDTTPCKFYGQSVVSYGECWPVTCVFFPVKRMYMCNWKDFAAPTSGVNGASNSPAIYRST